MKMQLTPEQEQFMLWLESQDVIGHALDGNEIPAEWLEERAKTNALTNLLRDTLPHTLEAGAEAINQSVLAKIKQA